MNPEFGKSSDQLNENELVVIETATYRSGSPVSVRFQRDKQDPGIVMVGRINRAGAEVEWEQHQLGRAKELLRTYTADGYKLSYRGPLGGDKNDLIPWPWEPNDEAGPNPRIVGEMSNKTITTRGLSAEDRRKILEAFFPGLNSLRPSHANSAPPVEASSFLPLLKTWIRIFDGHMSRKDFDVRRYNGDPGALYDYTPDEEAYYFDPRYSVEPGILILFGPEHEGVFIDRHTATELKQVSDDWGISPSADFFLDISNACTGPQCKSVGFLLVYNLHAMTFNVDRSNPLTSLRSLAIEGRVLE